jgi:hypothetical protein
MAYRNTQVIYIIQVHVAGVVEERVTVTALVLAAMAAAVTTWPRAGVVLLILIVLLFAIAAVLANLRPGRPAPPDEQRDAIGPPGADDAVAGDNPPYDV